MPEYDYKCTSCKFTFSDVKDMADRHTSICPACGKVSEKQFTILNIGGFRERDIDLFNDKTRKMDNLRISNKEQLIAECRKRDLVHEGFMHYDKEV